MTLEDFIQPLTLFLIWYIIPGYLSLLIFILISKLFTPTLKFSWKKINNFDKVVLSVIISTIIYYFHFYQKGKDLIDILKISSNDLVSIMGVSLLFSAAIAVSLYIFALLLNNYLVPFFYLLIYLPTTRFLFRKDLKSSFFQDFYKSGAFGIGPIYDFVLTSIKNSHELGNIVEVKLKSTGEILKGKINTIKRDYSEFGLEKIEKLQQ